MWKAANLDVDTGRDSRRKLEFPGAPSPRSAVEEHVDPPSRRGFLQTVGKRTKVGLATNNPWRMPVGSTTSPARSLSEIAILAARSTSSCPREMNTLHWPTAATPVVHIAICHIAAVVRAFPSARATPNTIAHSSNRTQQDPRHLAGFIRRVAPIPESVEDAERAHQQVSEDGPDDVQGVRAFRLIGRSGRGHGTALPVWKVNAAARGTP